MRPSLRAAALMLGWLAAAPLAAQVMPEPDAGEVAKVVALLVEFECT